MKKLFLFGAAHAFVLKTLKAINAAQETWDLAGFLDDDPAKQGQSIVGVPVVGDRSLVPTLAREPETFFFNNVMGHWKTRLAVFELLERHGCRIAGLVDPRADSLDLRCGKGVFVQPYTVQGVAATIGDYSVAMAFTSIGDDARIGKNVFVGVGARVGSRAVVGDNTFIGPNAVILIDRVVGEGALIGAGAIVTKDVAAGSRVLGPAAEPR